ncbi:iron-containing alcohol dehydrogenase family protein [Desulfofalx alkaliphila]|uniref:iron-containing alcohol dehydrogenase family protein n=1 Tax=Desulfofalx alkaliphila TaxID=105483 RepID=UPI0004E144CE|nr:iron-containing alcohol dehydrogenase family protein [Desulfofalx alkaliphila]
MQLSFYCPTKVFFEQECVDKYSAEMSKFGKKALIVTGGNSSKKNGSLKDMVDALDKEGIDHRVFDQVEQNPSVNTVYQGARLARQMKADFIVGIGGGSPLDAAKAVAVLAVNDIEEDQLLTKRWVKSALPVVAVPTTAGTGSEVTPYSILTVDKEETKKSIAGDDLFPVIAYMDARYMLNLPWYVTANTAVDALSHSIEGFINNRATLISDLLALESITIIGRVLKNIDLNNISLDERAELLYASMLAGMVISQTATNMVHAMGYPLTYYKNLPHGLANGVTLKAALEFLGQGSPDKVARVVRAMDCQNLDEVGRLLAKVLPQVSIKLSESEQQLFVEKTMQAKNIANCPISPQEKDIYNIFKSSGLTE